MTNGVAAGACLFLLAVAIIVAMFSTIVTLLVWNFALVPLFGLPNLEWPQAFLLYVGILLVGGAFRSVHNS